MNWLKNKGLRESVQLRGLLSATFYLDSHNQRLDEATREISRLKKWYDKALHDKIELEEVLRIQIQGLQEGTQGREY